MRSREISRKSSLIELLIWRGTFCCKPHLIRTSGSKVMSNGRVLKTIENERNSFLLLAVFHSRCSRLSKDSARSQHIYQVLTSLFTFQSCIRTCPKMTICEQFQTKCCMKIAGGMTLDTTDDKRLLQSENSKLD